MRAVETNVEMRAVETNVEMRTIEASGEEAPKNEKKDKKDKKDKKRKLESTEASSSESAFPTEPTLAEAVEALTKKSKKEKKDKEDDSPKKPIYSSAMAEEFLDRVKTGRPVTLQKAIARVEKDMGDKFNSEEVFSTLRLKREKDGNISVSVAGVKERKKSKDE
jgi:hypothetical protein